MTTLNADLPQEYSDLTNRLDAAGGRFRLASVLQGIARFLLVAVPVTGDREHTETKDGQKRTILTGREGTLAVGISGDWKMSNGIFATGDSRLGKGVLGAIPLHLVYEAKDIQLKKGQAVSWEISLELLK